MTAVQLGQPFMAWAQSHLQRRFALIAGGLLLLTSVVFLVLVTGVYRSRILAEHERASLHVNMLLQAALENAMVKRDIDGLQAIVADLGAQDGISGVMIVNPGGEVRFSSYPKMLNQPIGDPAFESALETQTQTTGFREIFGGAEVLRSINPVHNQPVCKECHGAVEESPVNGLLVVDYESGGVRAEARQGAIMLGGLGILVLLTIEGGLWVALRRLVIDRVDQLGAATQSIAQGDLKVRADEAGGDEIARLGGSFNRMARRLERSVSELQASEAFLQALIDAIPDGVRVIGPDFRIIMVNTAYCAQLGLTPDQAIGQPCYASSHKRNAPCIPTLVRCPVAEILQGDQSQLKCSHTHVTEAGSDFPVEVSAAPATVIIDDEPVPCVVESIRDLEAQLNISHEQRLSELGMLAAGVAHEVHNPLSSISLALRALGKEAGQSDKARNYIEIAEAEITNCQNFTESLLRLAAPAQSSLELVDLTKIIHDTASLLAFEAEQVGVEIHCDVSGDPRVLSGDSDMRILLFNLMLNAIHAMPDGGALTVTCAAEAGRVHITIADTGVGIAERDQGKVLLPFWTKRADGTQGRGLGLSICKSIVDRLGGSLSFDSVLNQGTTFRVELPDADEVTR